MDRRMELHQKLKSILQSNNVYFQPPPSVKLKYPCIIYNRTRIDTKYADNTSYMRGINYTLTLIGSSPESKIVNDILALPYCSYDRFYTADGLNHDVFSLFY